MGSNSAGELKTCRLCGAMFMYSGIGEVLCEPCKIKDEEDFGKVKDYIYSHPDATIKDTFEATGIRIRRITSYIRENRLIIPDSSAIFINCENCNAPIKSGRICRQCANELSSEFKKMMEIEPYHVGDTPKKSSAKMRFTSSLLSDKDKNNKH